MSKVIKKSGVFILEPTPTHTARQQGKADLEKVRKALNDDELRAILERVMLRIEGLERNW
jgi:hypothetical protein